MDRKKTHMNIIFISLLTFSLSSHASALLVVNTPTVVVLESPEAGTHIEDIIRYGTHVEITEEQGEWAHITYTGNHGWIPKNSLLEVSEAPEMRARAFVGYRGAYLFKVTDTEWGPFLTLPFETPLEIVEELPQGHNRWLLVRLQDGQTGYAQRSQLLFSTQTLTMQEMVKFSMQFLNSPYLWGGTTSFGYDCSGFAQMLYRQMGITLARNSYEQAVDPRFTTIKQEEAGAGDLVFFRNSLGKVVHMAMMINEKEFIHAFPKQELWICTGCLEDERWRNGYFYYGTEVRKFTERNI